ncbi:MAG: alanine dehydrogenase [Methylacidiphilales bacterium]|nr:alanine dehydrogenase [Candidatus Methylacidiphilales bacterium]
MKIGVPKEIKNHEYRVGVTPGGVKELIGHGHTVTVEKNAGTRIGFSDADYQSAGATLSASVEDIFQASDMIIKVKEPQEVECKRLRSGQVLFTYLHLAPDPKQTELLIKSGAICIAYETVTDDMGGLPLLAPMSEVAGRMSIQAGAHYLEISHGGSGVLLGGVPGTPAAEVLILGGGVVGINAAKMAVGFGAKVTIVDRSLPRLRYLDDIFMGRVQLLYSTAAVIDEMSAKADLIIGGVLVPGASAPKLIQKKHLAKMKKGSVVVDVAIDQGGCFETSHATTHQDPVFEVDGIVHYCVANMPGGVSRTSTMALSNATLPFAIQLANKGAKQALLDNKHLLNGLNVAYGKVCYQAVCDSLGHSFTDPLHALK